ncbi:hypothetical protein AGABI1DRAFT_129578 [Agaricus bisporus var. burnettii JB137-S8]|uniref:Uncharacterized protein n=1 Tax=Agaricus bisporus var. burnettii (strain JB137-S8 / ATCC MYA-4627 / FGSC 10392) TaxID=597362 RepID=K5X682_AGABU|nr:uncharacterized protein AGABI1DRAFT_129578 [Agaricus bisporus var. burnettii JB137-S8]EKM78472.1 hypothetical protein AGABI1DRAFT_129578 [Agaricus bisporus var. burnettii JB137-S8]
MGVWADPSIFPPHIDSLLSSIPNLNVLNPETHLKKVWQEVEKKGPQIAEQLLGQITKIHADVAPVVDEFKDSISKAISQAQISTLLSREVEKIYKDSKDEVDDPLSDDRDQRSRAPRDRARLVSRIMGKVGIAYVLVLTRVGVPREIAESQFNGFSLTITPVLLLAGKIIDKYPFLLNIIIFVVSMSLLPNLPLLGPILRSFGFGPLGPIKGSMAAWAQRMFWGGAVAPGSWFAIMQRLGMTVTGSAIGKLLASAGITAMFGRKTQGQQAL